MYIFLMLKLLLSIFNVGSGTYSAIKFYAVLNVDLLLLVAMHQLF